VTAAKQPHRAVHLRQEPRDGRLARAGIAEEGQVLRRRHLGQPGLLPARLNSQERDERPHLLFHRLEARERVELREQLFERPLGLLLAERVEVELLADLGAQLLAERL